MRSRFLVLIGALAFACSKDYGDTPTLDAGGAVRDAGADVTNPSPTRPFCGEGTPCPPNDKPSGAMDVTNGGTFAQDIAFAHTSPDPWACGDKEGRVLFYSVSLSSPRVYYFDTFGSDFDTVTRIFPGTACTGTTTTITAPVCADDACGGVQSQAAVRLPAGPSCIVVAQKSATETKGASTLHVVAGLDARALPTPSGNVSTVTGDTCTSPTTVTTDCGTGSGSAKELTYFFTTCGAATVTANTCGSTLDTVLFIPTAGGVSERCDLNSAPGTMCNAGDSKLTLKPTSAGVGFVGVTSALPPSCGAFTMTVTF